MKKKIRFSILSIFLFLPLGFAETSTFQVTTYDQLLSAIRQVHTATEQRIETLVAQEKVREAWETGKLIDEHILLHKERAEYGDQVIKKLANDLGASETELRYMLQFAKTYPIHPTSDELTWSHYRELLSLNDPKERKIVEQEAKANSWTVKEVREAVQKRNRIVSPESTELPEITPGPLYTYSIIRLGDQLKLDLGFGIYRGLSEKDIAEFKEGDVVQVLPHHRSTLYTRANARVLLRQNLDDSVRASDSKNTALYTYKATVTEVVDGDTFHAIIDLGFDIVVAQRVRLRRIDAPEILSAEGKEAKALLEKILARDHGQVILQSHELDQHGRPIADVWVQGKPIDQELLDQGLAVRIEE